MLDKLRTPGPFKYWVMTFLFGFVMMGLEIGYIKLTGGKINVRSLNLALAGIGTLLIGLSLILSGLTYFFKFAGKYIVYRKYLGIVGFYFVLSHGLLTIYRMGTVQEMWEFIRKGDPEFLFGLAALFLLLMMTIISNVAAARNLGNVWWRRLLRLGYVVMILASLHMYLLRISGWKRFLSEPGIPSTSLLLVPFILGVFLMRLALEIALRRKKMAETKQKG